MISKFDKLVNMCIEDGTIQTIILMQEFLDKLELEIIKDSYTKMVE